MKLVVLTVDHPTTTYFVNKIGEDFPIDAVFLLGNHTVGDMINLIKTPSKLLSKVSLLATTTLNNMLDPPKREKIKLYDGFLWNSWRTWKNQNIIKVQRRDLNTNEMVKAIRGFEPDIILLCAMPIISPEIISSTTFCLNLHKGITPDYRGTNSLLWPLYNGEPDCIGVTIHQVTKRIDGGRIANQTRFKVEPGDTPFSIYLKAAVLGTQLMKQTLREIQIGTVRWVEQDLSKGRVYHMGEFTFFKKLKVIKKLRKGSRIEWEDGVRSYSQKVKYDPFSIHPTFGKGGNDDQTKKDS